MAVWSRAKAMLTMTSPLGPDALIPTRLTAQEGISQPFLFDIEVISQQGQVDADKLLNQPVCVTLQAEGKPLRYFHGIVQTVASQGTLRGKGDGDTATYRLVVVPRLWFLSQTSDCRVYQQKSTTDILEQMFGDANLTDVTLPPSGDKREYTVQFNESDLTFATRLMEEEGYFYYFEHSASAHKLIIAAQNASFADIDGATLQLQGGGDGTLVTDWTRPALTARGKMKLKDYDPVNPDTLLQSESATTLQTGGNAARDEFRWPANTFVAATVSKRAKWEMEAAEAEASLFEGGTRFGKLVPGGKFKLVNRPAGSFDGTYAVRSVTHQASDDTWLSTGGSASYFSHFSCFLATVNWRQPMITPRPRMDGFHTALVLGPQHGLDATIKSQDGEEIHTDSLGRVKVRFYWDHRGEATGGQSIWARVIQPWAGKGWGAQFIPRVGTEVAVAFVDGDPDRPIVIGGLYNGRDTPIYSVGEKTKSGFRSRSTLKGSGANFNEFTFDDKKGSELVFLHAEKDLTTTVENDQTLTVDNCRIVTVKKDETVDIQGKQTIKVKLDHSTTVTDGNRSIKVSQGNDSLNVEMGNITVKADMGNIATGAALGDISIKADAGKIEIQAMTSITLKVGESVLKLDQSGISMTGTMIKIEGKAMLDAKGAMAKVTGDGMLTLKGGIMMLN